jgi:hypothetical protein
MQEFTYCKKIFPDEKEASEKLNYISRYGTLLEYMIWRKGEQLFRLMSRIL